MISNDDLLRVRGGDIPFDTFARSVRVDFVKLAQKLTVNAPAWLDVEDVAQEMLMTVPTALEQWRDGDYSIKRFVVFRACAAGRRLIKRARAYRGFETQLEVRAASVPTPHETFVARERLEGRLLELPQTSFQLTVMQSLARTQSVERSAAELMSHPDTRVMFAADPDLVRIKIRRVMSILASRATTDTAING